MTKANTATKAPEKQPYPASLDIDYPPTSNRVKTFFRLILAIPIMIVLSILTVSNDGYYVNEAGEFVATSGGGLVSALFIVTLLLILFRQKYPRWWFNFNLELNRFMTRVNAYLFLLTDQYPSTTDAQSVHLDLVYPNVKRDLHRGWPLIKWLLALPHYIVLFGLGIAAIVVTIIAWFAILFTGKYPRGLFDFVVGVMRWNLRVTAYVLLLTTDKYPPFTLD